MGRRCLVFASMLMVIGIAVVGNLSGISAKPIVHCGGNLKAILSTCKPFLKKEGPQIPPTIPCCSLIKDVDVPCVCKNYFKQLEAKISLEKALYVARTCGCSVPTGLKCGNSTIPPPPEAAPESSPIPEE